MPKSSRSLRPLGWLIFGILLALICALLVLGTAPFSAPGMAQPPV